MINTDDITKENIKDHNPSWPQITDQPYGVMIIAGPRIWKNTFII